MRQFIHDLKDRVVGNSERGAVLAFLKQYLEENCDFMPNSPDWHLPSCTTMDDIFSEFCFFHMVAGKPPICLGYFKKLFREAYTQVKIPKVGIKI